MARKSQFGFRRVALLCTCAVLVCFVSACWSAENADWDCEAAGKVVNLRQSDDAAEYVLRFGFKTEDGRVFLAEQSVNEGTFNSLKQGDEVAVKYSSTDPMVSHAIVSGESMSVITQVDIWKWARLGFVSSAIGIPLFFVVWLIRRIRKRAIRPEPTGKFSEDPLAAVNRWRNEWLQSNDELMQLFNGCGASKEEETVST